MHSAIWKLSALATVVGFGLLAVVVQQRGLGKSLSKTPVNADGSLDSAEDVSDKTASSELESSGQGDIGPSGPIPKTLSNGSSTANPSVEFSDASDVDAASFPKGKSGTSKTTARTGRRKSQALLDDTDELLVEPPPGKRTGARASRATQSQNAFDEEEDGSNPALLNSETSSLLQAGGPAGQKSPRPLPDGLDEESDNLLTDRPRGPSSRGRPSGDVDEGMDADVVGQAPNTRPRSLDEFEDEGDLIAAAPLPRTGARSGASPRTQPNRNPQQNLVAEEDFRGTNGSDANSPQDPDNQFLPDANRGANSSITSERGARLNSAFQDPDEDGIPHKSRPGNTVPPIEYVPVEKTLTNSQEDDSFLNRPEQSRPAVPPLNERMNEQTKPTMGDNSEFGEDSGEANASQEDLSSTPAVPLTRKRPRIDDGDGPVDFRSTKPRTENQSFAADANTPLPIQKRVLPEAEFQESDSERSLGGNTQPQTGRNRPNPLADEDDANSSLPPVAFPTGQQRPRVDTEYLDERATPPGVGTSPRSNDPSMTQDDELLDSNSTLSPITGRRDRTGSGTNSPVSNRPRFEDDEPGAAASRGPATNIIAPRYSVPPSIDSGTVRGRARVSIEKLAPPTAILGQPLIYSIVIRNNGNASARQVVVEDDLPDGVTMQGSIPQAEMTGRKLKWLIGNLEVGQEQKISVKVVPTAEGPVGSAATVNFVHDTRSATNTPDNLSDSRVTLELQYPQQVNVGSLFEVRFRLTNRSNSTLTELTILNQLPPGLRHESRKQDLEYKVKALAPGEILEVPLSLTASQTGPSSSRTVVLTQDERILLSKDFRVDVHTGFP